MRFSFAFPWLVLVSLAACDPEQDWDARRPTSEERIPRKLTSISNEGTVHIAVDERHAYVTTMGDSGAQSDVRKLSAAPLAGGEVDVLVSTRQVNINAIASNGRGVFFTDYVSTGSVYAAE
jgi:hypothetical protein